MSYEHLTQEEVRILDILVDTGKIKQEDLPKESALGDDMTGPYIGMDSMGPMRNPKTDKLFRGIRETLFSFSNTLLKYGLTFLVATNGPDKEGEELLLALNWNIPIKAFAVTEGGGKLVYYKNGKLVHEVMADPDELKRLSDLEERVKRDPLMKALLENTQHDVYDAPTRTPYATNIVLTFPNEYDTLFNRLASSGFLIKNKMPDMPPSEFIDVMLSYAATQFTQAIDELKLEGVIAAPLIKKQNRRIYITPRHLKDEGELSKIGGVALGSRTLQAAMGYPAYTHANSIYIADKAADVTGEGQPVIGSSEKTMIHGLTYFAGDAPPGLKVVRWLYGAPKGNIHVAEVGCKLAINITMDNALPKLTSVEGIPMLHLGSGLKSLEAITHLYARLHR